MKKHYSISFLLAAVFILSQSCSNNQKPENTTDEFTDTTTTVKDSAKQKADEMLDFKFFYTIAPSVAFSSLKNTAFNSRYNGFTWSISSNGNYSVKKLGDFGYNSFINGRGNNAQGYNFGTVMYGIYYNKNIYKKMFFVTASADNFAQKNRFAKSLVNNSGVSNLITTITPNRLFSVTLSFNFNKIKYAKYSKKTSVDVNDQVERLK